jgi:hypothetical protein
LSSTLSLRRGQGEVFLGMNTKGLTTNGSETYKPNENLLQDEMGLNLLDYRARSYGAASGLLINAKTKVLRLFLNLDSGRIKPVLKTL